MSLLDRLLTILDIALQSVGSIIGGPIGTGLILADKLEELALHAVAAYQTETGQPIDLSKIPPEPKV